jgi:hypothetical protein
VKKWSLSVVPQLKSLLAMVNLCIAEAEQRIAQQRQRIDDLQPKDQPTVDEKKTLDVMLVVAASMRDNQTMIQRGPSGKVPIALVQYSTGARAANGCFRRYALDPDQ